MSSSNTECWKHFSLSTGTIFGGSEKHLVRPRHGPGHNPQYEGDLPLPSPPVLHARVAVSPGTSCNIIAKVMAILEISSTDVVPYTSAVRNACDDYKVSCVWPTIVAPKVILRTELPTGVTSSLRRISRFGIFRHSDTEIEIRLPGKPHSPSIIRELWSPIAILFPSYQVCARAEIVCYSPSQVFHSVAHHGPVLVTH